MYFPQYWSKVEHNKITCWGWSDNSESDAQTRARQRAQKVSQIIENPDLAADNQYGYPSGPLREEVIERGNSPTDSYIISRNRLGCLVLNTSNVVFLDVDCPKQKSSRLSILNWLIGLFTKSTQVESKPTIDPALERARSWVNANSSCGLRAYRTAGGFRFLITDSLGSPEQMGATPIISALGVDPLYVKLCKSQGSFRARLSPKPWRIGLKAPNISWPFASHSDKKQFEIWQENYQKTAANYATCELVGEFGNAKIDSKVSPIIALHDRLSGATSARPLA